MSSEMIKFYCACGQKVSLPVAMLDQVGECPACDLALIPPPELVEEALGRSGKRGKRGRRSDERDERDERPGRRKGGGRTSRRASDQRQTRRASAPQQASGGGLPAWFYLSFALDATFFFVAWKAFDMPWHFAAAAAEVGAWSLRIIGLKKNW